MDSEPTTLAIAVDLPPWLYGALLVIVFSLAMVRHQLKKLVDVKKEEESPYRCPDCAEPVRREARVCKSCRLELVEHFERLTEAEAHRDKLVAERNKTIADSQFRIKQIELAEKAERDALFRKKLDRFAIPAGIAVITAASAGLIAVLALTVDDLATDAKIQADETALQDKREQSAIEALEATDSWKKFATECGRTNIELDYTSAKYGLVQLRGYDDNQAFLNCFGDKIEFDPQALSKFWVDRRSIEVGNVTLSQWGTVGFQFSWEDPNK